MKKAVVLFLTVLYVVVGSGFTTYTHLCRGVEQTVSFSESVRDKEGNCGFCGTANQNPSKEDCCKEVTKNFKLTEKAAFSKLIDFSAKFLGDALPHRFFGAVFEMETTAESITFFNFQSHSIPLPSNPLYIFYCVYRI